jgi:NAD(P)-dependent dehydrogenase (short-subunit alcohol dehydrogenase family)
MKITFDPGIAFITGGSGGIGAAVVRAFVEAGSDVVFTYYKNRKSADALIGGLTRPGRKLEAVQLALEDSAAVTQLIADLQARHGRIHSVVYASGPATPINFVGGLTDEEWVRTFAMDTHACFHLVRAALPIMKAQKAGSITAVTTTQHSRHVPMSVLSSAPKAAIESMLEVAAREYGRYGVRCNSVRSGWLDGGKFADGIGGQVTPEAKAAIAKSVPLGMLGDPADVANACVFLASRQARYITGEALSVDGGWKL